MRRNKTLFILVDPYQINMTDLAQVVKTTLKRVPIVRYRPAAWGRYKPITLFSVLGSTDILTLEELKKELEIE